MPAPEWSEERKLASMLHGLGARLSMARLAIHLYETRGALAWPFPTWETRYRDDVGRLLEKLGYPEWADAPMETCCQSGCGNPKIHEARSGECVYDPIPPKETLDA